MNREWLIAIFGVAAAWLISRSQRTAAATTGATAPQSASSIINAIANLLKSQQQQQQQQKPSSGGTSMGGGAPGGAVTRGGSSNQSVATTPNPVIGMMNADPGSVQTLLNNGWTMADIYDTSLNTGFSPATIATLDSANVPQDQMVAMAAQYPNLNASALALTEYAASGNVPSEGPSGASMSAPITDTTPATDYTTPSTYDTSSFDPTGSYSSGDQVSFA